MDMQSVLRKVDVRITQPLDLTDFHERFVNADGTPQVVEVWLNIPREKMLLLSKIEDSEQRGIRMAALQLGITDEEAHQLFSMDAPFCNWLLDRLGEMLDEYTQGRKKKSETSSPRGG